MEYTMKNYFDFKKSIHKIEPSFTINFNKLIFRAYAKYDDRDFIVMLSNKELIHIDSDHLVFDVAFLLLNKLNDTINKYNTYKK